MKRILYVGYTSNIGGIERVLLNVCKYLEKEKFEINFLIFKGQKVYNQDNLEKSGYRFFEITQRGENYITYCNDLKEIYCKNNFDIIHFNLMNFCAFEMITFAKKYSKARLIVHAHTGSLKKVDKKTRIQDKIGRYFTRNIDYLRMACGQKAGEYFFKNKDFIILNNGMEIEKFLFSMEDRNRIRKEYKIEENTKVFGHVGTMSLVKNHKFLIKVFYEYNKLESNSKMILIGKGDLKKDLEKQVQKLKIQDKVLFLDNRDDVEKIYSAMDIFVIPSLYEGFNVALMEAQVNGLTCYASTNIFEESNVSGNVAFLSLKEKPKIWAQKIQKANYTRDKYVINKIPDQFRIEKMIKRLTKIYEENK